MAPRASPASPYGAQQDDLVVCLISGGASALLPLPASGITLDEKQAVTRLLLACGATIHEINAVRKHISRIKGGQLARLAWPAAVESLLLSDVIGDDLDVIGSGPTAPDSSTFARAAAILEKYGIAARVPAAVQERIAQGMRGAIPETPKPDDPLFARVRNVVVGSNRLALEAAARRARELGYRPLVLASGIEGETREIARMHAAIARERPLRPPACIITGGETTVTLKGDGLGGRNQEFVLAAAIDIAGLPAPSSSAPAPTAPTAPPTRPAPSPTETPCAAIRTRGRSSNATIPTATFESLGDLVITGPTHTNVMDVRLILTGARR